MENHELRGSLVVARCYGGKASILKVWSEHANMMLLSEPHQFDRLLAGLDALPPVGFSKEDVFVYDAAESGAIASNSVDWDALERFDALSRHL